MCNAGPKPAMKPENANFASEDKFDPHEGCNPIDGFEEVLQEEVNVADAQTDARDFIQEEWLQMTNEEMLESIADDCAHFGCRLTIEEELGCMVAPPVETLARDRRDCSSAVQGRV